MKNHVSYAFAQAKDTELINRAVAVYAGLEANATTFPTPPFMLPLLMTAKNDFETKVAAAHKGSVAQTNDKYLAREVLLNYLQQLAAYVEGIALGNADTIRSAGFDVTVRGHTAPTQLAKPEIKAIVNLMTTQLKLRATPVPNAHGYELQSRIGAGAWTAAGSFPNGRDIVLTGLTPGTLYGFRVRAIGGSTGFSDWSDTSEHMCM